MALHQILAGLMIVVIGLLSAALFVSYCILKAYEAINADRDDYCQGSWNDQCRDASTVGLEQHDAWLS